MNLLIFNLAVDAEHVTLAFGLRWIEALSRRFDHIDVVTMRAGKYSLPPNVTVWSLGQENGFSEARRAARFYQIIRTIMRRRRISVAFTHMIPIFAVLFAPIARLSGIRNVLWYAHGATPGTLRIAHHLVDHVVSSTPEGFRIPSRKATFIGQGVDHTRFQFTVRRPSSALRLISVGRIAASKGLDVIIDALVGWTAPFDWQLVLVGGGTDERERAYAESLAADAMKRLPAGRVRFTGRLDADRIADELANSDVFLNLSSTGSLDKAIVEAMLSGCPVISSNDAFAAMAATSGLNGCAIARDPASLRQALAWFASLPGPRRTELAMKQSSIAATDHTMAGLIDRLVPILQLFAR